MNRRLFSFGVGFGLFWIYQKTGIGFADQLAAKIMEPTDEKPKAKQERWRLVRHKNWKWYERSRRKRGKWVVDGMTRPVNLQTDEMAASKKQFLDDQLVPFSLRMKNAKPHHVRKERDGRPPSRWLRSLNEKEIRIWLKTIEVPEAGVAGMTFFTHLTRDHMFAAKAVKGLSEVEQAKLHSAAHVGY